MGWSNCWLWAQWRYWRLMFAWIRAGFPVGDEPYITKRPSRSRPRWLPHYLVGRYDPRTDQIAVESFKPRTPTNEPWWRAWTHLLFDGEVRHGDWPKTEPEENDE